MFFGEMRMEKTLKPKPYWSYANTHICFQMQTFKVVEICFQENYDLSVGY